MSDNANGILKSMRDKGIATLFWQSPHYRSSKNNRLNRYKTQIMKSEHLISDPLRNAINNEDVTFLNYLFSHADYADIDLWDLHHMREPIRDIANKLIVDKDKSYRYREIYNGHHEYAVIAASFVEGFDWKTVFSGVFEIQRSSNYVRSTFRKITSNYARDFSESFKDFVDSEVFFSKTKPCYAARGALYAAYVEAGMLNSKTARKIRSDSSYEASVAGVKALFEHKDNYSNFDSLALQFSDSKHEEVVAYLAQNLPEHLLASIMGTEFCEAKRVLRNRLEKIEREREIKRTGGFE